MQLKVFFLVCYFSAAFCLAIKQMEIYLLVIYVCKRQSLVGSRNENRAAVGDTSESSFVEILL